MLSPHPKVRRPASPVACSPKTACRRTARRLFSGWIGLGPSVRPEGRTVAPPPNIPKDDRRLGQRFRRTVATPAPRHPKVLRLRLAASSARRRSRRPPAPHRNAARVSSDPALADRLTPEGTLQARDGWLLGAARTPEGVLRSAPPVSPSRESTCPTCCPKAARKGGGAPKDPPWLPIPGKPWIGSGQTDMIHRERTGPKSLRRPEGQRTDVDSSGVRPGRTTHLAGGFRYRNTEVSGSEENRSSPRAPLTRVKGASLARTPKRLAEA